MVRTGVAIYRGQALPYEIVDGLAIHDGHVVLGSVEEVAAEHRRQLPVKAGSGSWPERRDLAIREGTSLWPDGVLPYLIDPGFSRKALREIEHAIHEWISKTVITLVERTTESDYVRFVPQDGDCKAHLGRRGGEQLIWLSPDGCGVSATIHEIGHAVGLGHEHQRHDRNEYVSVSDAYFYPSPIRFALLADYQGSRPYDYASVMHYDGWGWETIPPGIPIYSGGLSPGDIDGVASYSSGLSPGDIDNVARLYGTVPTATTITTNPAGLRILVDGESVTTPAQFEWTAGSTHSLYAVSPQTVGGTRFVFGRWSDAGDRGRIVAADKESTWFQANYIVQRKLRSCPPESEAADVTVRPSSQDGFHVQGRPLEIEASTGTSRNFLHWSTVPGLRRDADRRSQRSAPGVSANPAAFTTPRWSGWFARSQRITEVAATYTTKPVILIDSNIDGVRVVLGGEPRRLPLALPADAYPNGIMAEAPATVPEEADREDTRYRFKRWSDGGSRAHRIRVPASGGTVRLELAREYRLRVASRNQADDGGIVISPPSEDGFYAEGARVNVRANPGSRRRFAGWVGEVSGSEPGQTIVMDGPKWLEAVFARGNPVRPGETKNVTLQATNRFRLYSGSEGYNVLVPPDASELTVRFQSSVGAEVDLYVHRGRSAWLGSGDSNGTPRVHADFGSTSPGASGTITITRASVRPLANDVYFIAFAVPPTSAQIAGTLSVEVRRSGIVKAWPPALAFVSPVGSDPGPQTVRLTHLSNGTVRYRVVSDASWLTANPQEWARSGGGLEEIFITANTAGLRQDTHRASLRVLKATSGEGQTGWTETGVEIPIALVVVAGTGSRLRSQRLNAVTIDSQPQSGDSYGAGEEIRAIVSFTDPVEVSGYPALDLRVGNQTRRIIWTGDGSRSVCADGYTSLEFRYLVQREDRDADGIDIAADALTLNGGSIQAADGAASALVLGGPATGTASDQKVDGSIATAPEVTHVGISSSPSNGIAYGAGETINVWVRFDVPVEVDGKPRLALNVGGRTRFASFWTISTDGNAPNFRYQVQPDDIDANGISIAANALKLNGGSIRNAFGADADLDLGTRAITDAADHKVDGSIVPAPEVDRVWISRSSRPSNGTAYGAGESIDLRVRFDQQIEVTGSPRLTINVGGQMRLASFRGRSSSGTVLLFRYAVQSDDLDADGISIAANALTLNGGSIRNAFGADADLDLGTRAITDAADHKVDGSITTAPEVTHVGIHYSPSNGTAYGAGESIQAWVQFDRRIEVTGRPRLALNVGGQTRLASFLRVHSNGISLLFRYQVQPDDIDANGISIPANALKLNGGSIRNAFGADAALDLGVHAITDAADHKVDGSIATAPEVTHVGISSSPSNGIAYGAGEEINVWVRFDVPVEVDGKPRLALNVGGRTRFASFWTISTDGNAPNFRYQVQPDDIDANGISIAANALKLNGSSIRNAFGADAALDLGVHAITDAADHKVDGSIATAPEVNGVGLYTSPSNGAAYGAGETIDIWVRFGMRIEITGKPQLALSVGGRTRRASLGGPTGDGIALWFRYEVQPDDIDPDGISIAANALKLNGGNIRSVFGADAVLNLGAHVITNAAEHKVDGGG